MCNPFQGEPKQPEDEKASPYLSFFRRGRQQRLPPLSLSFFLQGLWVSSLTLRPLARPPAHCANEWKVSGVPLTEATCLLACTAFGAKGTEATSLSRSLSLSLSACTARGISEADCLFMSSWPLLGIELSPINSSPATVARQRRPRQRGQQFLVARHERAKASKGFQPCLPR